MSEEKSTPGRKKGKGPVVDARVGVNKKTLKRISEFAKGADVTQDKALNYALDQLFGRENPMQAGMRLRELIQEWDTDGGDESDDES